MPSKFVESEQSFVGCFCLKLVVVFPIIFNSRVVQDSAITFQTNCELVTIPML